MESCFEAKPWTILAYSGSRVTVAAEQPLLCSFPTRVRMTDRDSQRQVYERRTAELRQEADLLSTRDRRLSASRLATVLLFLVIAWAVFDPDRLSITWLALPIGVFIGLVVAHERCAKRRQRVRRALEFYERGRARLDDRWAGTGPTGERFVDRDHPYADDLDIFGEGSLYQLLCTARTTTGRRRLAEWLGAAAPPAEIEARQQSADELAPRTGLREDLAVLGAEVEPHTHPEMLASWARAAPALARPRQLRLAAVFFVVVTFTVIGLATFGPLTRYWVAAAIAVQALFALRYRAAVVPVIEAVGEASRELNLLHDILTRVEGEQFESPPLRRLMERLRTEGQPPSVQIGRLRRLVDLLDSRRNQMFAPFSALLLWSTQLAAAIEQWRSTNGRAILDWLDAIAEIEALDCLAAYRYEHPDDPFPRFVQGPGTFKGAGLGHPLLPEAECVRNDVDLGPEQQVLIVSGSNMSGKSTLMRTVGINAVLAQAGAPVRATSLQLSPLRVGGSIRVRDSLRQGMSGFYAEIHRFRSILDLASGDTPVLFMLEEILHTTNSHDRRVGAEALLRSLLERGAIGLVTTHDLAITRLAEALPASVNVHFVDELVDGEIRFDYRLRQGVVERSNAVDLMREIGLDV